MGHFYFSEVGQYYFGANIREHRSQIGRSRALAETLLAQLTDAVERRDKIQRAIEELFAGSDDTACRNALLRIVSLPTHVVALRDLSTAQRTLVGLERQAFGLAEIENPLKEAEKESEVHPTEAALAKLNDFLRNAAASTG